MTVFFIGSVSGIGDSPYLSSEVPGKMIRANVSNTLTDVRNAYEQNYLFDLVRTGKKSVELQ